MCVKTKINDSFGNCLYHLFMVIWGMLYWCFTHIILHSHCLSIFIYILSDKQNINIWLFYNLWNIYKNHDVQWLVGRRWDIPFDSPQLLEGVSTSPLVDTFGKWMSTALTLAIAIKPLPINPPFLNHLFTIHIHSRPAKNKSINKLINK